MSDFTISLLKDLNLPFSLDEKETTKELAVLRTNFKNGDEVQLFIQEIEKKTNTKFRIKYDKKNLKKNVLHKQWICQHSSFRKKPGSKKNVSCKSFIDVAIKRISTSTIKDDEPLPCIIKIDLNHVHSTVNADALRRLDVNSEVKKEFEDYFKSGLSVPEARRLHEDKLIASYDYSILANSSLNPTDNQVYYIYNKWRTVNFGPISGPFHTLKEKLRIYENEGAIVKYNDDQLWSILVITPVMERAQHLSSSSEIIFLDSTSGCESTSSTFTVLVTASKAGGIPIAILLHPCQTTESYLKAFKLLKNTAPYCFGGSEAPAIFMTDDSAAEKNALRSLWPSSRQLLCHFHVAQAEWRWLISNSSDICESERQDAMKLFQSVMYSETPENLQTNVNAVLDIEEQHPKFVCRFRKFFTRREEWLLLDRLNLITRNQNTNNICEATIRIIKEIVLSRTRAYNVAALVDFIINVFNKYLIKRLLKQAYNRDNIEKSVMYEELISKVDISKSSKICQVGEGIYFVPSSQNNVMYIVDANIGYCTCISGKTGALCKHQFFFMNHLKLQMPNAPCTSAADRFALAQIALGLNCPPLSFFEDFGGNDTVSVATSVKENIQLCNKSQSNEDIEMSRDAVSYDTVMPLSENTKMDLPLILENASKEEKDALVEEIKRVVSFNASKSNINKLTCHLKSINNDSSFNEKLMKINAALSSKRKRKIRVQPISISRRRKGISKRSTAIPAGRPSKLNVNATKRQKRKHSLMENVKKYINN